MGYVRRVGLVGATLLATACVQEVAVFGPLDAGANYTGPMVTAVAVGRSHTVAIADDGLFSWGEAAFGQLGQGEGEGGPSPARVGTDADWMAVTAGERHSCALKQDGQLFCFGAGERGQLGIETSSTAWTPMLVPLPEPVTQISGQRNFNCAIGESGALWCWGANTEGQLGQPGVRMDLAEPIRVTTSSAWQTVDTGQGHACGIQNPGTLWCWGRNTEGQSGQDPVAAVFVEEPTQVGMRTDWAHVATGQSHTCAVDQSGGLHCFGGNPSGQLGLPDLTETFEPTRVGDRTDWDIISAHAFTTCGLTTDGQAWCWGRNAEGQLGLLGGDRDEPTALDVASPWAGVVTGRLHSCGWSMDGQLACAGSNENGELGIGDAEPRDGLVFVIWP